MPGFTEVTNSLFSFLEGYYLSYGYLIVFLGSFVENTLFLGWLLPGGIVTSLGGFYAHEAGLSLSAITCFAIFGATIGKSFDYVVGFFCGKLIRGRLSFLGERIILARRILEKHGTSGIFLTSIMGPLRSILMLTAGMVRVPYFWFLKMTFLASVIWGVMFVLLGYFLGYNRVFLERTVSALGIFGWFLFIFLFLLWVVKQFGLLWSQKRDKSPLDKSSRPD